LILKVVSAGYERAIFRLGLVTLERGVESGKLRRVGTEQNWKPTFMAEDSRRGAREELVGGTVEVQVN
jgi:hypothetical protein